MGTPKNLSLEDELAVGGEPKELTADAPQCDHRSRQGCDGSHLYARRRFVRRSVCQQRLAAGIATVNHQVDLGQCGGDESRNGQALGLKHGQKVALRIGDSKVKLPVYEIPGCAPGVVATAIGYGRTRAGMVGGYAEQDVDIVGVDVSPIRRGEEMLVAYNVEARPNYEEYELATTQDHWAIDELVRKKHKLRSFSLVREGTTELLEKVPEFAAAKGPHVPHVGKMVALARADQ